MYRSVLWMTSKGECMDSTGTPMSSTGDAAVGHILGNGAAAAQIQTAQLTDLPCHVVGVQHPGDVAYQLGVGIAGRALAAAAGVLEDAQRRGLHRCRSCGSKALAQDGS